jgi:hypothetical protein
MMDVAESLGKRLVLPLNYPVVGWKELVNIQAPKNRLWARDERALDLLTRCLEVKTNCKIYCAYFRNKYVKTSETYPYVFKIDPSKRITANDALTHDYLTREFS